MSEINTWLSSLGLSPENDNSQFLTTSSFRRYNSNNKTNKLPTSAPINTESQTSLATPVIKRKKDPNKPPAKKRSKKENDDEKKDKKNNTDSKAPVRKVSRYCPKLNTIVLYLKCEWKCCGSIWNNMDEFLHHIDLHLTESEQNEIGDNPKYECEWEECDYVPFECIATFRRHVRFHAFHTKLKQIGLNVLKNRENNQNSNQPVPKCNLDEKNRNIIPELPFKFECAWAACKHSTDNPELFYRHIKEHVNAYPAKLTDAKCEWFECKQIITNKSRFMEHIRHHSQEKIVSCPVCGALFASITRFLDHCSRSTDSSNLCFQCSHCNKKFATNNLLKEHTRKHINKIKCPVCDMTCTDRNELSKHILYKHTTHKPYKCDMCDHACKTEYDLQKHMTKHNERFEYQCNECEFKTKDMNNIKRHILKFHMSSENSMNLNDGQQFSSSYMCHVCNKVYCQGSTLSKHLKKAHNFEWPSGHSRFRYKLESDGYYRLQTLRYESLELFELLNQKTPMTSNVDKNFDSNAQSHLFNEKEMIPIDFNLNNEKETENTRVISSNPSSKNMKEINITSINEIGGELDKKNFEATIKSSIISTEVPGQIPSTSALMPMTYNADEIHFDSFDTNQAGYVNQGFLMQLETPTKINSQELLLEKKTVSSKSSRLEFDLENFLLGSNFEIKPINDDQ